MIIYEGARDSYELAPSYFFIQLAFGWSICTVVAHNKMNFSTQRLEHHLQISPWRVRFLVRHTHRGSFSVGQSPARVGKIPVQLWQSERHTQYPHFRFGGRFPAFLFQQHDCRRRIEEFRPDIFQVIIISLGFDFILNTPLLSGQAACLLCFDLRSHSCKRTSCFTVARAVVFASIPISTVSKFLQLTPWTNLECPN